jgi:hypothetical protein
MSRLSVHLPRIGALVLSVLAAAASYSVHQSQSTAAGTETNAAWPGSPTEFGGNPFDSVGGRRRGVHRAGNAGRPQPADRGERHGASEPPIASKPRASPSRILRASTVPPPTIVIPQPRRISRPDDTARRRHRAADPPRRGVDPRRHPARPPRCARGPHELDDRGTECELQRIGEHPPPRAPEEPNPGEDVPPNEPGSTEGPSSEVTEPVPDDGSVQPVQPPAAAPAPPTRPPDPPDTAPPDCGTTTDSPPAEPDPGPTDPDDQAGNGYDENTGADDQTANADDENTGADDQTANADDEDAGADEQDGEAEDESPVAPGGSEGADDGIAGDGDDAATAPASRSVTEPAGPPAQGSTDE